MKCPWCGSPRNRKRDNRFEGLCSRKCLVEKKKYEEFNLSLVSEKGFFNMVTEAIVRCFSEYPIFKKNHNEKHLKDFINGKNNNIVDIWADCTDNFNKEKLIKNYARFVSSSAKNFRPKSNQDRVVAPNEVGEIPPSDTSCSQKLPELSNHLPEASNRTVGRIC